MRNTDTRKRVTGREAGKQISDSRGGNRKRRRWGKRKREGGRHLFRNWRRK